MTIAYICVFIACVLPIVCAGIAKQGKSSAGRYDNQLPRDWERNLDGHRKRAAAAQANSWEALPLFISAVLIAHATLAPQGLLNVLAVVFIALRCVYIWAYVSNQASFRSLVWFAGILVCGVMFFLRPLATMLGAG